MLRFRGFCERQSAGFLASMVLLLEAKVGRLGTHGEGYSFSSKVFLEAIICLSWRPWLEAKAAKASKGTISQLAAFLHEIEAQSFKVRVSHPRIVACLDPKVPSEKFRARESSPFFPD